jgi:hypothetical protein
MRAPVVMALRWPEGLCARGSRGVIHGIIRSGRASAHQTAHVTPEVFVRFEHVVRTRAVVIVVAATVTLAATASPAFAAVPDSVGRSVHGSQASGDRIDSVAGSAQKFRRRYQLRLSEARKLLGG